MKRDPSARPWGRQFEDLLLWGIYCALSGARPDAATIALARRLASGYDGGGRSVNHYMLAIGLLALLGELTPEQGAPLVAMSRGEVHRGGLRGSLGDAELCSTTYGGMIVIALWCILHAEETVEWEGKDRWFDEDENDPFTTIIDAANLELSRWLALAVLTDVPAPSVKSGNGQELLDMPRWNAIAGARSPSAHWLLGSLSPVFHALLHPGEDPGPPKTKKGRNRWRGEDWLVAIAPFIRDSGGADEVFVKTPTIQEAEERLADAPTLEVYTIRRYDAGHVVTMIPRGINPNTTACLGVVAEVVPGERTRVTFVHPSPPRRRAKGGKPELGRANRESKCTIVGDVMIAEDGAPRDQWTRTDYPREPFLGSQSVVLPPGPFREIKTRKAGT